MDLRNYLVHLSFFHKQTNKQKVYDLNKIISQGTVSQKINNLVKKNWQKTQIDVFFQIRYTNGWPIGT